jgi:hypothetical protein
VSTEALIQELHHNATVSGNRPLERRLADTAIWFHKNRSRIPMDNLAAKQRFLEKGFEILIEINALLLERVRELEGTRTSKNLWLPRGMKMNEREFA